MRLLPFALGPLAVAALLAAYPVAAKEGVKATLTTSVPLDAPAGTDLRVSWSLFYVDESRRRQPFGAGSVFVRLISASGAGAEEAFGATRPDTTGQYSATVVVPAGGIGDVEIGLMGWRSDATGNRRGDMLFPITNDPVPGASRVASSQMSFERPATGVPGWTFVLFAGVLSMLAVGGIALVLGKRRSRGATPRRDRELRTASASASDASQAAAAAQSP
jgi:hypothetical protein